MSAPAVRRGRADCRCTHPLRAFGGPPGFDIAYPETNSSHWGETDVVSKVLDAVSELGSDAGFVALDKKICTKVLVERPDGAFSLGVDNLACHAHTAAIFPHRVGSIV